MLEGRLRSRCMGLLEVHRSTTTRHLRSRDVLVESSVDLMHRTVFEFLHSPGVWIMDCLQIDQAEFDATLVLSHMSSYLLYLQEEPLELSGDTCSLAKRSVLYVQHIEKNVPSNTFVALKNLTVAFMQKRKACSSSQFPIPGALPLPIRMVFSGRDQNIDEVAELFFGVDEELLPVSQAALLLAIEADFLSVTQEQDLHAFTVSQARLVYHLPRQYPLLYHGIAQLLLSQVTGHTWQSLSPEMFRILLHSGCDLNETFFNSEHISTTPWESWKSHRSMTCKDAGDALHAAKVTLLMLQAGVPTRASTPSSLVISLASGDPLASRESPSSKDWRDVLLASTGKWRDAAENAITTSDQDTLKECCDKLTEIVGAFITGNTQPAPQQQYIA
jgi:hypothetical protein